MAAEFRGTFTPLVTPFQRDGRIDFGALDGLIDWQIEAGVEGLVMLGTTGECPTISAEEYRDIIRVAVARGQGRVKIIAGVGSNDTRRTMRHAEEVCGLGVDALLVLCPYYSKPTQAGIYDHFLAIAEGVSIPQIVYNIAGRTGVNIETETLVRLSDHTNIVGVKEASDDINQVMEVIRRCPDDFAVLSGCDHLNYPLMALGGDGVISTLANLLPVEVKAVVDHALRGDYEGSRALHYDILPIAHGCFIEGNPIPVKTALAWLGRIEESFRLPIRSMMPQTRATWHAILTEAGILASGEGQAVLAV